MTDTEKMDVILEKVVFIGNKVDSMDVRLGRVEEKVDSMDIRLGKVEKKVDSMDIRLGKVEERVGEVEKKVDSMDVRLGKVEERVGEVEKKIDSMDTRLGKVEERIDSMDGRLTRVEKGVIDVKNEIVIVRCIMENELDHNIKLIAEGHYDLNRKLDKALHFVGDVQAKEEVQDVLLTLHEAKLKELSGRLDLYAG